MFQVRTFSAVFLAALIALTSVSMTLARSQMRDHTGAIVLCTGTGPVTVQVHSQGQPIEPMPICPDCAFAFVDDIADASPQSHVASVQKVVSFEFRNALLLGRAPALARARGPPSA